MNGIGGPGEEISHWDAVHIAAMLKNLGRALPPSKWAIDDASYSSDAGLDAATAF